MKWIIGVLSVLVIAFGVVVEYYRLESIRNNIVEARAYHAAENSASDASAREMYRELADSALDKAERRSSLGGW